MAMLLKAFASAALIVSASLMVGCGTSSAGLEGSKHQTMTGVSVSGYPAGKPKDAESPALSSTTEQNHSNPTPKVPESELEKPVAK